MPSAEELRGCGGAGGAPGGAPLRVSGRSGKPGAAARRAGRSGASPKARRKRGGEDLQRSTRPREAGARAESFLELPVDCSVTGLRQLSGPTASAACEP